MRERKRERKKKRKKKRKKERRIESLQRKEAKGDPFE